MQKMKKEEEKRERITEVHEMLQEQDFTKKILADLLSPLGCQLSVERTQSYYIFTET